LISWKYSLDKISKDLELAKKKKEALDYLFNSGKISVSTYESLGKGLSEAILEIEAQKKSLTEEMTSKIFDLEKQISMLELFLASSEIQYVAGDIDEGSHANEIGAFTLGLDAVKQQLSDIKEVIVKLMPEVVAPTPPPSPSEVEEAKPTEVVEKTLETSAETSTETLVEVPVETSNEAEPVSEEVPLVEPLEVSDEVVAEEVTIEEPLKTSEETPTEEAVEIPIETPAEDTPVEEEMPSEEELEIAEETVDTDDDAETCTEEIVTEDENETSAEETSSYDDEKEE
jgi:hypothetical protein